MLCIVQHGHSAPQPRDVAATPRRPSMQAVGGDACLQPRALPCALRCISVHQVEPLHEVVWPWYAAALQDHHSARAVQRLRVPIFARDPRLQRAAVRVELRCGSVMGRLECLFKDLRWRFPAPHAHKQSATFWRCCLPARRGDPCMQCVFLPSRLRRASMGWMDCVHKVLRHRSSYA